MVQGSTVAMKMSKRQSAIALGSNLGDSTKILEASVLMIKAHPHIDLLNCSRWYQTKPVGPPQPDYLNGCITIKTELSPEQLLEFLLNVEQKFGRERKEKWGARTLDLDIILYDNLMIDLPHLKIPHPLMRERAFVLTPLAEIAPSWLDPLTGLTAMELRNKLENN